MCVFKSRDPPSLPQTFFLLDDEDDLRDEPFVLLFFFTRTYTHMMTSTNGSAHLASSHGQQQPQLEDAVELVQTCLGKRLLCTMNDGRQAYGILTCIDRLYVL